MEFRIKPTNFKLFEIVREEKVVAQGCIFQSGKCTVSWLGEYSSVAVYDSLEQVIGVHGHEGTEISEVANIDGKKIEKMIIDRYQDGIENIDAGWDVPSVAPNARYVWDERDKALALLARAHYYPKK